MCSRRSDTNRSPSPRRKETKAATVQHTAATLSPHLRHHRARQPEPRIPRRLSGERERERAFHHHRRSQPASSPTVIEMAAAATATLRSATAAAAAAAGARKGGGLRWLGTAA